MNKLITLLISLLITNIILSQSQWETIGTLPATDVKTCKSINNNIFLGTNLGVYVSTNDGVNWVLKNNGISSSLYIISIANNGTNIFCSNIDYDVYSSTNDGNNWTSVTNNLTGVDPILFYNNKLYATTTAGFFISTNSGGTWINKSTNIPFVFEYLADGSMLFIATMNGVKLTTDDGINWISKNDGLTDLDISDLYLVGTDIFLCGWNGVYKSTNNGDYWFPKTNGLATEWAAKVIRQIEKYQNKFIALRFTDVYMSTNNGELWGRASDGLPTNSPYLRCMVINNNYLYAFGTAGGLTTIYKRNLDIMTSTINSNNVVNNYHLYQNYPNPFNPSTKIKFDIPKSSNIKISVYDIAGKEISILVNQKVSSGSYEVQFNGEKYSSGIYFYKLESDDFVQTNKMILLK